MLASFSLKPQNLKNAPKLRNYRPDNSNIKVFIANDLTREQQIESQKLRTELSRRRGLGESVIIRRGNIAQAECCHFNARSIVNKIDELQVLVDYLNPDIIVITEAWLSNGISFHSFFS